MVGLSQRKDDVSDDNYLVDNAEVIYEANSHYGNALLFAEHCAGDQQDCAHNAGPFCLGYNKQISLGENEREGDCIRIRSCFTLAAILCKSK